MRHRCDSRIINYLTLMTLKTPEMTGTKSKFRSKFRFRLYSVPATEQNFAGILNLAENDMVCCSSCVTVTSCVMSPPPTMSWYLWLHVLND
jgi:hypothetical protein